MEKISSFFLLIVVFTFFLLFFRLGDNHLTNWDEAWYADISRNMRATGNLITPVWNKEIFFEKPPFYFWLSTLSLKIFGISEFSIRFPSALAGLGLAIMVYFFGKEIFNKHVGIASVFILFSSPIFLYRSRTGNMDTLLTLWMTISIFSFLKGINKNPKWFFLMGISFAFGFLTKGIIGLYPLVVVFLYLTFKKELKIVGEKWFLLSILMACFLILSWILFSFKINGNQFINQFLLSNFEKFDFGTSSFSNFSLDYFVHLKSGLKIWFLFLLVSFFYLVYRIKDKNILLLVIYFTIFFLVMSFSKNKSNWFILPILPLASVAIAYSFLELVRKFLRDKLIWGSVLIIFLISLVQNLVYKNEYIVPDIAGDEAKVALAAKKKTQENDVLYLTNYYYPTTVYYSERKVYAVYSENEVNRAWWIKSKSEWADILQKDRVFIVTTKEEFENLKMSLPEYKFDLLYQSGQKLLIKKV